MRRLGVLLAALLAGALLLSGCATGHSAVDVNNGGEFRFVAGTPAGTVIPEGKRATAPTFSGTLLDGGRFSSSSLHGAVGVINFWGSWCPPCRVETPEFQQVYAAVQHRGVRFLGVDVKEQSQQFAKAFLQDQRITYPSLFDPRGEVALAFRDYPANAIPSTIVLDRKGRVAAVYTGPVSKADLTRVLGSVAKEG
jgi:peroxiredoxin/predicted small secreted protein